MYNSAENVHNIILSKIVAFEICMHEDKTLTDQEKEQCFQKLQAYLKKSQLLLKNANEARCLPVPSTANIIHTYRLIGIFGDGKISKIGKNSY